MSTLTSIRVRDVQLDAATALLAGGELRIYTGTQPAGPASPATGDLLIAVPLGSPAFAPASAGTAALVPPAPATVTATGTAGWFRLIETDLTTGAYDGSCSLPGESGELQLPTLAFTSGATLSDLTLTLTLPA